MEDLRLKKRIKKDVRHQGIGGSEIFIEFELNPDDVLEKGAMGNWACFNFMKRRKDFKYGFPHKLYYGKVNGLGYVVAEDELED